MAQAFGVCAVAGLRSDDMGREKKPGPPKRFKRAYAQEIGMLGRIEVLIDTQTGVNYLFYARSESGGLTPLLDKEGRPVITPQGKDPE